LWGSDLDQLVEGPRIQKDFPENKTCFEGTLKILDVPKLMILPHPPDNLDVTV